MQAKVNNNGGEIPCGTKFLRVLTFAIFAEFAIRKNKFPQNKITAIFFSVKNYSTVAWIAYKNTGFKQKMP